MVMISASRWEPLFYRVSLDSLADSGPGRNFLDLLNEGATPGPDHAHKHAQAVISEGVCVL